MARAIEFGIDTFGDVTVDEHGERLPYDRVLRQVVAEAELAERVGLDVFGLGEHHRADFAVSAPEVVLAAIAARTERLRLGTAVTVLSSDDPVRVYERFATLDGLSGGRAEVVLGRGSFTESFPLFGFELGQYEELFEERLEIFARLRREQPVTWRGRTRAPLTDASVYPHVATGPLTTWIGVGGSPESVVRAARHRMPLMVAIIGGAAARFAPLVDLYRRALDELGSPELPVGVHSPGFVADDDATARDEYWPHHRDMTARIGRERGWAPPTREGYEAQIGDAGSLYVGSPETVAAKIAETIRVLGLSRFDLKYSAGTLPHPLQARSIELYGTRVVPRVRELLAAGR